MKALLFIALVIFLILLGFYLFTKNSPKYDQAYNWDLGLTKPLDYDINFENIAYYKEGKEVYRQTTMNNLAGWSGMATGTLLHNKIKERLPDSVRLSYTENETKVVYSAAFAFPAKMIVDYWNENYGLLQQKWGADYPQGQLSLKLGIAPNGMLSLWISDLDINTSGFAMQIDNYKATTDETQKDRHPNEGLPTTISNIRFRTTQFYTFEGQNVVAIDIRYRNGESQAISLKSDNGSLLEVVNANRGWGIAQRITVHWFDNEGKWYRSTYQVGLGEALTDSIMKKPFDTHLIYLLDRPNDPSGEWNKTTNTHIIQLVEESRETTN